MFKVLRQRNPNESNTMNQMNLFPTVTNNVELHTPTTINGVTFTVAYKGHQAKWGQMRAWYQISMSRGAVGRTFDFFCKAVDTFPIADFVECISFDQQTLDSNDLEDVTPSTIVALQVNEMKIRRVFGTTNDFHLWAADYLYAVRS